MRSYARSVPAFWIRGSGKKLRGDAEAQALAKYLFDCPSSNMIGLYYLPLGTMVSELGWDPRRALLKVIEAGIAEYDPEASLVYLPKGGHFQIGPSLSPRDKQVKGVEKELEQYRYHEFANRFIERYRTAYSLSLEPNDDAELASPFGGAIEGASQAPSEGSPRGDRRVHDELEGADWRNLASAAKSRALTKPLRSPSEARQGTGKDQAQARINVSDLTDPADPTDPPPASRRGVDSASPPAPSEQITPPPEPQIDPGNEPTPPAEQEPSADHFELVPPGAPQEPQPQRAGGGGPDRRVDEVWGYFLRRRAEALGEANAPKLSPQWRAKIRSRLKGFTVEQLRNACDVLFAEGSFWVEHKHTTPAYVFRSDEQVQKLLDRWDPDEAPVSVPPPPPDYDEEAIARARQEQLRAGDFSALERRAPEAPKTARVVDVSAELLRLQAMADAEAMA